MLVRLLYASRPVAPLSQALIDAILAQSLRANPPRGITGILCYNDQLFMQVLEGGREAVNDLYNAIVRDERHREVRLLAYDEIGERRFGGWTMGYVNVGRINPALLLKYGEKPVLDPFAWSGRAALALLDELIASAAVVSRGS
ncbi:MAG: BLUF domain-containing protein [Gammaproteobacteria bacterium]